MKTKFISILFISLILVSAVRAADPGLISTGARSLAIGKTGLALFSDINALFVNPANLGAISKWQFSSMYTNFLGDMNYSVAGVAVPTSFGVLGVKYIGTETGDIPLIAVDQNGNYDQNEITFSSYKQQVIALSYGLDCGNLFGIKDVALAGLSLKLFDQNFAQGSAQGLDLDVGLRYRPLPWLSLGMVGQNYLPSALGDSANAGIMKWNTGWKDPIPSTTTLGIGCDLGPSLNLEVDQEMSFISSPLLHIGAESWLSDFFALRAGVDQELLPQNEVLSNLTLGMGLRFSGFAFDYAYHPYSGLQENTSHFFSISYLGQSDFSAPRISVKVLQEKPRWGENIEVEINASEKLKQLEVVMPNGKRMPLEPQNNKDNYLLKVALPGVAAGSSYNFIVDAEDMSGNKKHSEISLAISPAKPQLKVQEPKDRSITENDTVIFSGIMVGSKLFINNEETAINEDGSFSVEVKLNKIGSNKIFLVSAGENGNKKELNFYILRVPKEENKS